MAAPEGVQGGWRPPGQLRAGAWWGWAQGPTLKLGPESGSESCSEARNSDLGARNTRAERRRRASERQVVHCAVYSYFSAFFSHWSLYVVQHRFNYNATRDARRRPAART